REGLFPPQILVMTFTEAATAELRERVRERLAQGARYFADRVGAPGDDFLRQLRSQIAPEQWSLCAWRLDLAAQWMDEAAIFTIHGWSSRMLKTHAFDSASLFEQTRLEDADNLRLRCVQDYWRRWFYALDASALQALKPIGSTPQELHNKLAALWKLSELAPGGAPAAAQAPDVLLARWAVWQRQRVALEAPARLGWKAPVIQAIEDVASAKILKNYRANWLPGWLEQMADWAQGGDIDAETLARFSSTTLVDKGWAQAARWPVLDQIEALHTHLQAEPQVVDDLLAHAAQAIDRAYRSAKAQAAQFDFSDLLQNLYRALQAPDGRLAAAIAAQYPVALVDEFQDTDPWQFGSLSKIYGGPRNMNAGGAPALSVDNVPHPARGLIMIGDPKQAIYSFRGADLATYLQAREQVQGIYTLPGNYRSTAGVVAAVNTVFGQASAPFGSVPFLPVTASNPDVLPLQVAGQPQTAMTVWHLPYDKTPTKPVLLADMAAVFATQMVALLNSGAARSGDMAVLVRDWSEAAAIREALRLRGVRSVYLSERNSVFASAQAQDLWRILRAVASPGNNRLLRAALATLTWGLSWPALHAVLADEAAWDALVEQFMQWQRVWRTQGFLPMLSRLLHDQGLAARLLQDPAQGERALTNLLHLGELLQAQSLQLQGEGALLRYLAQQLLHPKTSGEAAQLRLESDAHLVQVVTLHKAKGLEYPLVFLPFVSLYKEEKKDSGRPDTERLAEDIRLLYVALTRAKQALWLGVAQAGGDVEGKTPMVKSALSALLGRSAPGDLWACLQRWACADIAVLTAPAATLDLFEPVLTATVHQGARVVQRQLSVRWWSASFSALTRDLAHASAPEVSAGSELDERLQDAQTDHRLDASDPALNAMPDPTPDGMQPAPDLLTSASAWNDFPAGSAYGTLLHDLLEWQARHGWPGAGAGTSIEVAQEWTALLARSSRRLNLSPQHAALLPVWVQQVVEQKMPLALVNQAQRAIQLKALQAQDMWPEMGFSLPVHSLGSAPLDQLITSQVWPGVARAPLQPRQLQGMLTGFMDLVLLHQGRYYVLDYKSNKLPDYAAAQLQHAMLAHRYDVQATLYLLALHRLLKARLADYDYDRHVGGALYVFLRGAGQANCGVLHLKPPRALIEALDKAFCQPQAGEGG
ncbi:MAG: exodeoxyribonuclease V subunit beta, partial [Comamonadaceae bacterium CG12_big_fil_rev_8_21_14_0_65_59_15]